ncbi:MAG TPA: ATP-binding protein [Flavitalea sp.]|nr:ATP-binding protein [Flavitalea sp.]
MDKRKKSDQLILATKELAFQNEEKGKRAAELVIADKELAFQTKEKGKRAAELVIADKELVFQTREKGKRAAELIIANKELAFQNEEKEKRAAELIIANKELLFQNQEKEKRAAELIIANKELLFQNEEKEKRAAELIIANDELKKAEFHIVELNVGLERKIVERTAQLEEANRELEAFSYSVSHDLRAPLRAINGFTQILIEDYLAQLDENAKAMFEEIVGSSQKMGQLIDNLLEFSHIGKQNVFMGYVDMKELLDDVITELKGQFPERNITITLKNIINIKGDLNMLRQVFINMLSNAFKYTGKKIKARIEVGSYLKKQQCIYYVKDNGAGFDMKYYDKLFGVFQRLHGSNEFEGSGVGLAIIKRIVTKHEGTVWAKGKIDHGSSFYISLPGS